ncbi:alpha/beta hydrolase [Lysobacter sp. TY2-98]|uniref:alpha/beta hydrolase n=1 Tax=Lysobacter sp. TY2-98 TaxID=2290922 RepID=UPI000E20278D|nr:alpha/beta fold hydrolase [Lysobacter sp. TY2-98]AXK73253.1 alpha/beta hydrolase [Lysobacter sp. TY2-98]
MSNPAFPSPPPAGVEAVTLDGPAGPIEAVVDTPDADVAARDVVAIVCHPLSTEGGSLTNKVVTMAARALRELGATTVRFNFRGVGKSAGTFDNGIGESEDLRAVVDWVRREKPGASLWLGGFSFGAFVSLRMADELQPDLLFSIAPPAGRAWDFDNMGLYTGPWFVIQGDADEIVEPQRVYDWLDRLSEMRAPPTVFRIPGASHFFHGKLMELRQAMKDGVHAVLHEATSSDAAPGAGAA